ncbi:hypothetical protein Pfo_015335 [Paulownia fortunei]|nr:hypothetical protein Pfo_015335 [Paulownia fortunei]
MKSDDDLNSTKGSDDEKDRHNFCIFNQVELYNPSFELEMLFSTKTELRQAIHSHAIKTKKSINITKNDKIKVHAKCVDKECGWKLHALKLTWECTFQIRKPNHNCGRSFHVKKKSNWLSGKYVQKFKYDPKRNVKGFRIDVMEDIRCLISNYQAYRAKKKVVMIEESPEEQYSLPWDYAYEIKRTNPGTTILYLFSCIKMGFFASCRPFIGVDGCHLKGPHGGVLLTAVEVEPNNNIYPIAYVVVGKEENGMCDWFLTFFKIDLNIEKDFKYTFMSDKQKGLIQAFEEVFPNSAHRFCVKHMHSNFKNIGFRGQAFKSALWNAAKATTVNEFRRKMKEIRDLYESAAESHFTDYYRYDMLLNSGCESLNSNILDAMDKPIVSMCEWIMEYLTQMMQINRDRAQQKLGDCIPIKADDYHYQISYFDGTKYSVNLNQGTCGCRKWDLSGILCKHALSAIYT